MLDRTDSDEYFFVLCEYFQLFVKQTVDAHEQYNTPSGRYIVYEKNTPLEVSTSPTYVTFCVAYVDAHDQKSCYDIGKKEGEWCENFADWLFHRGNRPELHIENHAFILSIVQEATILKNNCIQQLQKDEEAGDGILELNLLGNCFMRGHNNTVFRFQSHLSAYKTYIDNYDIHRDDKESQQLQARHMREDTEIRLLAYEVARTVLFHETWQELRVMRASVRKIHKHIDQDEHDVVLEQLSQLCMYKFGEISALFTIVELYPSPENIQVEALFYSAENCIMPTEVNIESLLTKLKEEEIKLLQLKEKMLKKKIETSSATSTKQIKPHTSTSHIPEKPNLLPAPTHKIEEEYSKPDMFIPAGFGADQKQHHSPLKIPPKKTSSSPKKTSSSPKHLKTSPLQPSPPPLSPPTVKLEPQCEIPILSVPPSPLVTPTHKSATPHKLPNPSLSPKKTETSKKMAQKHDGLDGEEPELDVLKANIKNTEVVIKQQIKRITGYITGLLHHRAIGISDNIKAYAVNMFHASAMDQNKITDSSKTQNEQQKYVKPDTKTINNVEQIEQTLKKFTGNVGNKMLGLWNRYRTLNPLQKPLEKIVTLQSPHENDFTDYDPLTWDKTPDDRTPVVVTPVNPPRVNDGADIDAEVGKFQTKYNNITAAVAQRWYDEILCHRDSAFDKFETSVIVICLELFENLSIQDFFLVTKRLAYIYENKKIRKTTGKPERAQYVKLITDIVHSKCERETLKYFNHLPIKDKYKEYSDNDMQGYQWAKELFACVHV